MTRPDIDHALAGSLRVWWIPQIPMEPPYYVLVASPAEAKKMLDALAYYDLFLLKHNIRDDYNNSGGLEVFEDGEWVEWESDDCDNIDEWEPPV